MYVSEGSAKKQFEDVPAGTHVARCVRIIDLGTQKHEYQGEIKFNRQVLISWELPNTKMSAGEFEGKPFLISKFYTASLHDKSNLRKDLESWRGRKFDVDELKSFDLSKLSGVPCMLSVIHNDQGRAKVNGVMSLIQGMTVPPQVNPSVNFSFDKYDAKVFECLTTGVKGMIMQSPEYQLVNADTPRVQSQTNMPVQDVPLEAYSDDVPF